MINFSSSFSFPLQRLSHYNEMIRLGHRDRSFTIKAKKIFRYRGSVKSKMAKEPRQPGNCTVTLINVAGSPVPLVITYEDRTYVHSIYVHTYVYLHLHT